MSAVPENAGARVPSDDELWALLGELIREGYHLVPQQIEAALAVVSRARAEGPDVARRWPYLLTPILATSASKQDDLMRRLSAAGGPVVRGRIESAAAPRPVPDIARRGRRWPAVVATAAALALALLVALLAHRPDLPPPVDLEEVTEVVEDAPGLASVETTTEEITTVFIVVSPLYGVVRWFLILAPLLALGGWLGHRWWLQRCWRARGHSEADLDLLDLGHRTAGHALFAGTELAATAQQWRRFRQVPTRDLDPERTVAATLQESGLFTPVYRARPLTPDYVVLVEEQSRHDHMARLADVAIDRLAAEDVQIERYYYAGGVGQLRPAGQGEAKRSLVDLEALGPHRSLVVVGDGADLFEPLSARLDAHAAGVFDAWEHRALLSTRPIGAWADRELALLDSGLALGTASRAGLRALGEHVAAGHPEHALLLDGILVDRGTFAPPKAPAAPQVALAELLDALRLRLQVQLAGELPASARTVLTEALGLLDDPKGVPRALDLIARAPSLAGAEIVDSPRLLAAIRARLSNTRGRLSVFLGYAREDRPQVQDLCVALEARGFAPWLDVARLIPGEVWKERIERAIGEAGAFLACLSSRSIDKRSYVQQELRVALSAFAERPAGSTWLIPVRLDKCDVPDLRLGDRAPSLRDIQWVDLWQEHGFDELVIALDRALGIAESDQLSGEQPPTPLQSGDDVLQPGTVFRDIDAPWCPEMVGIPPGEFMMSWPHAGNGPQHLVRIDYPLAVGRFPVTFEEYDHFAMAKRRDQPGDRGWGRGRRPAINVSWDDAKAYVEWLARESGQPYRLLSEAEWEYACRAGTTTRYWWGDDISPKNANYFGAEIGKTTEVGTYPPNRWGLYDMHGNVGEWVEDCWHDTYEGAPTDGSAWLQEGGGGCSGRVVRGGSWHDDPVVLRSAMRLRGEPEVRLSVLGFRVSRMLTP